MATPFSDNLRLALKMLSLSAGGLASELGIDKSVVSRWLNGSVKPSGHNLARLSTLVARRIPDFKAIDWERPPASLARLFGADPEAIVGSRAIGGLPLANWDHVLATAMHRSPAYEGFFRTTRPHPRMPGRFLREIGMIRRDATGLARLVMGSAESRAEGWMIPLQGLVYCIATDLASGALLFGIFNGTGALKIEVFDGLALMPAADMGRAPLASAMLCERIGDLSGDAETDDARYEALASVAPLAPEGSVPRDIQSHLVRDFGPAELAKGGDWLLAMSLARTLSRGRMPRPGSKPRSKSDVWSGAPTART
jgi:transcriptional regulator with XRE-family HTH domain